MYIFQKKIILKKSVTKYKKDFKQFETKNLKIILRREMCLEKKDFFEDQWQNIKTIFRNIEKKIFSNLKQKTSKDILGAFFNKK